MPETAAHAWHSRTVTGERWLVLKAEYAHRCGDQLARQHTASVLRIDLQATAEFDPGLDSHLPHA